MSNKQLIERMKACPELHDEKLPFCYPDHLYRNFTLIANQLGIREEDCVRRWRELLFEYVDKFHRGSDYEYRSHLEFTSITAVLKSSVFANNNLKVVANIVNVEKRDDASLGLDWLMGKVVPGKQFKYFNYALNNRSALPIVIYDIEHNFFSSPRHLNKHFPFLLHPGQRFEDYFHASLKVTIVWTELRSPMPVEKRRSELPGVRHEKDTLEFVDQVNDDQKQKSSTDLQSFNQKICSSAHGEILLRNLSYLCYNLDSVEVLTVLVSKAKITDPKKEEIRAEKTSFLQNNALVTWLSKQPMDTFQVFCQALDVTMQSHLAKRLRDDLVDKPGRDLELELE